MPKLYDVVEGGNGKEYIQMDGFITCDMYTHSGEMKKLTNALNKKQKENEQLQADLRGLRDSLDKALASEEALQIEAEKQSVTRTRYQACFSRIAKAYNFVLLDLICSAKNDDENYAEILTRCIENIAKPKE